SRRHTRSKRDWSSDVCSSDLAVRRVPGVAAGVQYTVPSESAIASVRAGERPALTTRQKHVRECFVVLEEGADPDTVREAIVTMRSEERRVGTESREQGRGHQE